MTAHTFFLLDKKTSELRNCLEVPTVPNSNEVRHYNTP